ncbi:DUF4920 domain-containing protein [Gelidibacter salicanalis]|uniref:DUF4920 domain-containing protein n=1 Tax=Gelidibacter salicanalis TaxID=291193 RepID=A0A934KTY5_9FLAO|nr:DUF4920 domain-containing protein [Gelidibacter salicanalis]MBJ7879385.1 DUF4920 domain-containing protein [Gelidibacter salicanalis]
MRKLLIVFGVLLSVVACKTVDKNTAIKAVEQTNGNYTSIGTNFTADAAKSTSDMADAYTAMRIGDTINAKMVGTVDEVCQSKGCWLKLNLEDGNQVMVKFKDYGFFMPKDIAGQEVVLNGKAYVNEVPVEEQRHYAEDAGQSAEEIEAIIEPKKTFSFEADGVLLKSE